jgi:hypothetical protein
VPTTGPLPSEIGAAADITFLGPSLLQAAAEPVRRGGRSVLVVHPGRCRRLRGAQSTGWTCRTSLLSELSHLGASSMRQVPVAVKLRPASAW